MRSLRSRAFGSEDSASRLTILENDFTMANRYRLRIPRAVYEEMLQQAHAELPNECCGLLAGAISTDGTAEVSHRYALINVLASPVNYESEPKSMLAAFKAMRAQEVELLAIYHSHPTSPPVPSRTDCALNQYGQDVIHLIVSLRNAVVETRAWRLTESNFEEVEWEGN
jgi:proteasome lid subunit RPN8/RPN11